jgi:hypothetical protein
MHKALDSIPSTDLKKKKKKKQKEDKIRKQSLGGPSSEGAMKQEKNDDFDSWAIEKKHLKPHH